MTVEINFSVQIKLVLYWYKSGIFLAIFRDFFTLRKVQIGKSKYHNLVKRLSFVTEAFLNIQNNGQGTLKMLMCALFL